MPTVLSDNLSRWQVACISLPVEHASGFRLVNVPLSACSDPDRSPMRIPEHVITKAIQYLQMSSGKHNAVEVKGIGIFNVNGLRRMRFFVEAAATKRNISEEEQWFSKFSWSMTEQIREVLWDNPSNYILGNIGGTAVSPRLLSTISCERSTSDDAVFVATTAVLGVSTVLVLPAIMSVLQVLQVTVSSARPVGRQCNVWLGLWCSLPRLFTCQVTGHWPL